MNNLQSKHIVHITPEIFPYSRTGGMAFAVSDIVNNLAKQGLDVTVFAPYWGSTIQKLKSENKVTYNVLVDLPVKLDDETTLTCSCQKVIVEREFSKPVTYYFVNHYDFFGRYTKNLYLSSDRHRRMYFFSRAVVEIIKALNLNFELIHIHDWMVSLIPQIIKQELNYSPKTLLTLHNISYQGSDFINMHKFDSKYKKTYLKLPKFKNLETWNKINFLRQGIKFADYINTVSTTYAEEIISGKFDEGLKSILATKKPILGIMNGIDYSMYNPTTSKNITFRYDKTNFWEQRKKNKIRLFRKLQIPKTYANKFLLITTHRLCYQKGFDYVFGNIEKILELPICFVMLGDGDKSYIDKAKEFENKYSNFFFLNPFNTVLEEKLISAGDAMICASIFEPCGTGHMKAMRYGVVEIVNNVGGLADSVTNFEPTLKDGNGFIYNGNIGNNLINSIEQAIQIFESDKSLWKKLVLRAMSESFSWETSIQEYIGLYRKMVGRK